MEHLEKIEEIKELQNEAAGKKEEEESPEELKRKEKLSNIFFVAGVGIIIIVIALIFSMKFFLKQKIYTVDELHMLNLENKLKEDQGQVYKGFSFVLVDGLWNTQSITPDGSTLFNVYFHYPPKTLEQIPVEGILNKTKFDANDEVLVTFDPLGSSLQYVALAVGEFDKTIIKAFGKMPVAACDKNETEACIGRPIVTCNSTDVPVLYILQKDKPKVIFSENCIIVEGKEEALVKAMERLLYVLYGIMER